MHKNLEKNEQAELHEWLKEQGIKLNKIHREFSDAVAMAQLIKKFFPKLVDMHNYPASNKVQGKYENWNLLNTKVLKKLKIDVGRNALELLAKSSTEGVLEKLLYKVMLAEKALRVHVVTPEEQQEHQWTDNDEMMTVNINKKVGDAIVKLPQKMILYSIYEETVQELQSKIADLKMAQSKVKHLEQMIDVKSSRIDKLLQHLNTLSGGKVDNHLTNI